MCAGTCHLTAFCSQISPKWQFLHRHAGKSVPARKKLFRQCAGTRSPQQHPPPLTWLGCLVLGCPFGVCAGVLVTFFAPQPVKHVSIHYPKIDLLFALTSVSDSLASDTYIHFMGGGTSTENFWGKVPPEERKSFILNVHLGTGWA